MSYSRRGFRGLCFVIAQRPPRSEIAGQLFVLDYANDDLLTFFLNPNLPTVLGARSQPFFARRDSWLYHTYGCNHLRASGGRWRNGTCEESKSKHSGTMQKARLTASCTIIRSGL